MVVSNQYTRRNFHSLGRRPRVNISHIYEASAAVT